MTSTVGQRLVASMPSVTLCRPRAVTRSSGTGRALQPSAGRSRGIPSSESLRNAVEPVNKHGLSCRSCEFEVTPMNDCPITDMVEKRMVLESGTQCYCINRQAELRVLSTSSRVVQSRPADLAARPLAIDWLSE